jgi:O-antigen/teichoic acid export membrane protein
MYQQVLLTNAFAKNFFVAFTGTSSVFLIQILLSPVISRIYSPEAYAHFAIYNVLFTNILSFAGFSYSQGLLSRGDKHSFVNLSSLVVGLSVVAAFVVLMYYLIFVLLLEIDLIVTIDPASVFWLVMALMIILSTITEVAQKWTFFEGKFKNNTISDSVSHLISRIAIIVYGLLLQPTGWGLIYGEVIKTATFIFVLFLLSGARPLLSDTSANFLAGLRRSRHTAREYANYPKYIFPGQWLNMFSNQLPVLFIAANLEGAATGIFAFAVSMLNLPSQIFGRAINPVFMKSFAEEVEKPSANLFKFTARIGFYLTLIGFVCFGTLFFFGEQLFVSVFGDNWQLAGQTAEVLSLYYFLSFVSSPISSVFLILRKEKSLLSFQILLFIIRLLSLSISILIGQNYIQLISLYCVANALGYFCLLIWELKLVKYYK